MATLAGDERRQDGVGIGIAGPERGIVVGGPEDVFLVLGRAAGVVFEKYVEQLRREIAQGVFKYVGLIEILAHGVMGERGSYCLSNRPLICLSKSESMRCVLLKMSYSLSAFSLAWAADMRPRSGNIW